MEEKKMPCPACPEDCRHHSDTCHVVCKTWKGWREEQKKPKPRMTLAEAYTMNVLKKKREQRRKQYGKG